MQKFLISFILGTWTLFSNESIFADNGLEPIQEIFEPVGNFPETTHMRVAAIQWAPPTWAQINVSLEEAEKYKQGNREKLANLIRIAAGTGAKLVVLPEFTVVGYPDIPELPPADDNFRTREDIAPYVEVINGPTTNFFGTLAKELKITIHFGLAEVDPDTNRYYDGVVAVGTLGEILASYRKNHLFELENQFLDAGNSPGYYDHKEIGRVGLLACSDVYHYPLLDIYKNLKTDVFAFSTSWTQQNTGWAHFIQGSIYTGAAMVAANHPYFPDSGIINADGSTQSHIRQTSGLVYGYLPKKIESKLTLPEKSRYNL